MSRGTIALACAVTAVLVRVPLLWDDPHAPGYDGWYYVLQVRSLLDGNPLFADRSLVFGVLAALAVVLGDVVVANKVAACLFAAIGAAGVAVGAHRWTGAWSGALVAGVWWAVAPGHLIVSMEFLKNEAGLAIVGLLLAVVGAVDSERATRAHRLRNVAMAAFLVVVGALVHKLTGLVGLLLALGVFGWAWMHRFSGSRQQIILAIGGGVVLLLGLALFGLLRGVDIERVFAPQPGDGPRFALLLASRRIHTVHRGVLVAAHVLPLVLAAISWRMPRARALTVPLMGLAVGTAAPLLPFGFDLTSWRLLLLAFVPMSMTLAVLASRAHWSLGVVLAGVALATAPSSVVHTARAEPDYAGWESFVPTLQAHIPADSRVVAHRGLCGFIWAVADRICENFDPQGPVEDWWRVAYGMGAERLAPYAEAPPVPLKLGYTLISEPAWRRFRADHAGTLPLVLHPRNPYRPRPGFVYGPGERTPVAVEGAPSKVPTSGAAP